eukprot:TRINITY_DN6188_c0_g1_i4.p1 TRINITY_DN6188_c0_g1~~TRINITY_DN6188_c0_g1_i4.p1  ORF type:complete len:489 (-),score=99.47 TRINITY_DN6188_c0_g1_i4:129-1595(-)
MISVAKRYEEILSLPNSKGVLQHFVVSSHVPVIHLTTVAKYSKKVAEEISGIFQDKEVTSLHDFDLFEPSNDVLTWSSADRWRAYWPAKAKHVFLYIRKCSDAEKKVTVLKKLLLATPSAYEFSPCAIAATKGSKILVAFEWLSSFDWRGSVSLASMMNGVAKPRLEIPSWHLCTCLVSVWEHYKDVVNVKQKSTFMNPIDPAAILLVTKSEKFYYVSPLILQVFHEIEQQNAIKIESLSLLKAPECMKHKLHPEKSSLWSLGFILYKLYTGSYPFDDLKDRAEDLYRRLLNGPEPEMNWLLSTTPFFSRLLPGLLKHDTTSRLSWTEVDELLGHFKQYSTHSISQDMNAYEKFRLGVLVDAQPGKDGKWYTARFEQFKGNVITLNFLTGKKKRYHLEKDQKYLRGFTEHNIYSGNLSPSHMEIIQRYPRFLGVIPVTMDEEVKVSVNNYTGSSAVSRQEPEGSIETVTFTPVVTITPNASNYVLSQK